MDSKRRASFFLSFLLIHFFSPFAVFFFSDLGERHIPQQRERETRENREGLPTSPSRERNSIRSYRQHFERWDLQKYNCKKRQQRRQQQRYGTGDRGSSMLPSPPRTPLLPSSRHQADDTRGPLVVTATAGHHLPHAPSPHYFFDEPTSPLDGFERTPTSQQFDPARFAQRRLSAEGEGYGQLALPPGAAW